MSRAPEQRIDVERSPDARTTPPCGALARDAGSVRHVRQLDKSGCGIACVAMLTGLTYETVRAAWVGYSKRRESLLVAAGNGAGMRRGDLTSLLLRLGGPRVAGYIVLRETRVNGQPFGGHWIVRSGGRTYDPDSSPNAAYQPCRVESPKP